VDIGETLGLINIFRQNCTYVAIGLLARAA
jgi:hypothetical protein